MKKGEKVLCVETLKTWRNKPAVKPGWIYVVESLALVDGNRYLTDDYSKASTIGITLVGIKPLDPQVCLLPAGCFVPLENIKRLKRLRRGKSHGS